jgi:hypothetical protein
LQATFCRKKQYLRCHLQAATPSKTEGFLNKIQLCKFKNIFIAEGSV